MWLARRAPPGEGARVSAAEAAPKRLPSRGWEAWARAWEMRLMAGAPAPPPLAIRETLFLAIEAAAVH